MAEISANKKGSGLFSSLLTVSLILIGIFFVLVYTFGYVVKPGDIGVRQITIGPQQGFSRTGLKPGYHWSVPLYSKIHFIPKTLQQLHLHRNTKVYPQSEGSLEVQTTDGSSVNVDISVWYFFYPETTAEHGGPAELLKQVGFAQDWKGHIHTAVTNELKKSLGRLSTSQFYNPQLREREITRAKKQINDRLQKDGIGIEAVLLRRYTYSEERIDRAIFEKNLQDQEEALNAASGRLAEARAALEKVAANWDAKIKSLRVESDTRVLVIQSEADLYEKKKKAEADFLVAKATADIEKMKSEILAKNAGAEVFVARELAPLLSSLKGGLIDELDPYNLEDWVERLGVIDDADTK